MEVIVMVDQNWAIGKDGDQLVYIPADLKHFKETTLGHPIAVGRKTLATFPKGLPLKGRRNLILSQSMTEVPEGGEVFSSLEDLVAAAPADTFVVGGASLYEALLPHCTKAYVTKVGKAYEGADTFFPNLDSDSQWVLDTVSPIQDHEGLSYVYVTYLRK